EVMRSIVAFDRFTVWIISGIVLLVLALLITVIVRFNARSNPVPSRTTHNTLLEVGWTVLPVLILVAIAIPSFRLLYKQLDIPEPDLTVKATGYQWYWGYDYPDNDEVSFVSTLLDDSQRNDPVRQPRLLAVDYAMVVPVGKVVRLQVTGADVIHSFAIPAFGIKIDASPGRLNETWFKAEREGTYYGQCSELCGRGHAFMPIEVRVVSEQLFEQWANAARDDIDNANRILEAALARESATSVA